MKADLAILSSRIITLNSIIDGTVLIKDGKILAVVSGKQQADADVVIDAGTDAVMAGLIDPHVHINEPGRTEWEGFETATKAAAAGGITTLIDMPLNSTPVTTTVTNFELKLNAARLGLYVNCGFYGGVVPDNEAHIEGLLKSGVFGIKSFLIHSGIDDFPATTPEQLESTLLKLKKYNLPLLVHCEWEETHEGQALLKLNPKSYSAYLNSRPKAWEDNAIGKMIALCKKTNSRVHIVHLSAATSLAQITAARKEGLPLTVETGPHYLYFNAEMIPDGQPIFKCAPPIREKENNEQLWKALENGTIDFVATDHSPAPPDLKAITTGDFEKAWGGIAGLQFSLPAMWQAASSRGFTLQDITKWMSANPATFLGLENEKGEIKSGMDADLFIFNPEKEYRLDETAIHHRHKISPYVNQPLKGIVKKTFVAGNLVFDNGTFPMKAGKILIRK